MHLASASASVYSCATAQNPASQQADLLTDFAPLLKYIQTPSYRRYRLVARGVFARVLRILVHWESKNLPSQISDKNLLKWHKYAVKQCMELLIGSEGEYRSLHRDLPHRVYLICNLMVLGLGAFCSALTGREWAAFPDAFPQDAHLRCPPADECLASVIDAHHLGLTA